MRAGIKVDDRFLSGQEPENNAALLGFREGEHLLDQGSYAGTALIHNLGFMSRQARDRWRAARLPAAR